MSRALSLDLRERVLAVVAAGASHRQAGERFGVSAASVSRWRALERGQGTAKPKAPGGDRRSGRIEAHKATILAGLDRVPDCSIGALRRTRAEQGLRFGFGTLQRFFKRHSITRKETAHAAEQERPDIVERRAAWREDRPGLDPERLVFLDVERSEGGPPPRWPAPTVGRHAESGSAWGCPLATGRPPPSRPG